MTPPRSPGVSSRTPRKLQQLTAHRLELQQQLTSLIPFFCDDPDAAETARALAERSQLLRDDTQTDLDFSATLQGMSDDDFLQAWHVAVTAGDEERIAFVESAATHRFGLSVWHHRYAARFPEQTRYRLPTKGW